DSKTLYKPGLGLRQLERGIHAALATIGKSADRWTAIVKFCNADPDSQHQRLAWHDGFDCALPVDASTDELELLGPRLSQACDVVGIRPIAIRARYVFPAEFNEATEYFGTKGAALSHVTVGLLRKLVDEVRGDGNFGMATEPIVVVCDKHGGRNFYTALLQHH